MEWSTYEANSIEEVQYLSASLKPGFTRQYSNIVFNLPNRSDDVNLRTTHELNSLYIACGCAEGTFAGVMATALYAVAVYGSGFAISHVLIGIVIFFLGTTFGKIAGIQWHLSRLKQRLNDIVADSDYEPPQELPEEERINCAVE
jgi:hypothetical protein